MDALQYTRCSQTSFQPLSTCPQAAEARKQEPISPISSRPVGDAIIPGSGRLTGGNASTVNSKTLARQVSPGLCKASPASNSGNASESAPKPNSRVIRLSAPKPIESAVATTKTNDTAAVDSVPNDEGSTKRDPPQSNSDAVGSAGETVFTSRSPAVFTHATIKATSGGTNRSADADRVTGRPANRQGGGGGDLHGTSAYFAQQRRYAVRQREVSRTLPPLPPDAEILEVSVGLPWYSPCLVADAFSVKGNQVRNFEQIYIYPPKMPVSHFDLLKCHP